jgi:hypothetical protein
MMPALAIAVFTAGQQAATVGKNNSGVKNTYDGC